MGRPAGSTVEGLYMVLGRKQAKQAWASGWPLAGFTRTKLEPLLRGNYGTPRCAHPPHGGQLASAVGPSS